jgi:hypothetical protein
MLLEMNADDNDKLALLSYSKATAIPSLVTILTTLCAALQDSCTSMRDKTRMNLCFGV